MMIFRPLLLLLTALSFTALAAIDVTPKVLRVRADNAHLTITNQGTHAEYVTLSLYRLNNPGVPYDQEQLTPVNLIADPLLYVVPFKLSLAPMQQKTIMVRELAKPEREVVYRLVVKPVTRMTVESDAGTAGVVNIKFNFFTLIRQLPASERHNWDMACSDGKVRVTVTGNVREEFTRVTFNGRPAEDFNVYPGTPLTLEASSVVLNDKSLHCR